MTIDWTKPLELIDGTPVRLFPYARRQPDCGGDYHVDVGYGDDNLWFVREDGTRDGAPFLRNRQPAAELVVPTPERPTLRDRFAMAALTGILSRSVFAGAGGAREAYAMADAMLAARHGETK